MTDKSLAQLDLTIQKVVTSLRTALYSTLSAADQRKRVVVNYDPLFQIATLPVVIIDQILLRRNRFFRQIGYEDPVKDMEAEPVPKYTRRKNPLYVDMVFTVVAVTDKVMTLMPLEEGLLAWREATPYLIVGEDVDEQYEYQVDFIDDVGFSGFPKEFNHLNQFIMRFVVEGVRIYPGLEEAGHLVAGRYFRFYKLGGETLIDELTGSEVD